MNFHLKWSLICGSTFGNRIIVIGYQVFDFNLKNKKTNVNVKSSGFQLTQLVNSFPKKKKKIVKSLIFE